MRLGGLVAGLLALASCGTTSSTFVYTCTVDGALDASEGAPGDTIVVSGGPFSEPFDTTVRVAGYAADVLSVDRADCAFCDECIEAASCAACTECEDCAELCDLCVETTTFVVPEIAPGATTVVLVNRWGSTLALPFTVLAGGADTDTDSGDTDTDAGDTDTGATDTDTGAADTDTGATDTDTGAPPPARRAPRGAARPPAEYRPAGEFLVCPRA